MSRLTAFPKSAWPVPAAAACTLILSGCITINIYFPASAAEKAADRIIDEVWQLRPSGPAAPAPEGKP